MAIQMTRAEYEKKYGVKPVASTSALDTSPAPIRMTRAEYDRIYNPKPMTARQDFAGDVALTGQRQQDALTKGADASSRITERVTSGEISKAKGMFQKFGTGLSTVANVAVEGARGAAKMALSESAEQSVAKFLAGYSGALADRTKVEFDRVKASTNPQDQKVASDMVKNIQAYQTNETLRTDIDATGGILNALLSAPVANIGSKVIKGADALVDTAKPVVTNAVSEVQKSFNPQARNTKAVARVVKEIAKVEDKYAPNRKANSFSKDVDESRTRIAQSNVLENAIDNNGMLQTDDAIKVYSKETIDGKEDVVRKNLENEGRTINLNETRNALKMELMDSKLEGADLLKAIKGIENEVRGLGLFADEFGNVPP